MKSPRGDLASCRHQFPWRILEARSGSWRSRKCLFPFLFLTRWVQVHFCSSVNSRNDFFSGFEFSFGAKISKEWNWHCSRHMPSFQIGSWLVHFSMKSRSGASVYNCSSCRQITWHLLYIYNEIWLERGVVDGLYDIIMMTRKTSHLLRSWPGTRFRLIILYHPFHKSTVENTDIAMAKHLHYFNFFRSKYAISNAKRKPF